MRCTWRLCFCWLLIGPDEERQVLHADDARAAPGGERRAAVVAHGPVAAAVFRLAALAGPEGDRQGDESALGTGGERGRGPAEALIDPAAEGDHRDDGEHREQSPLQPLGERQREGREADQDRGAADEYEVELGVDEGQLGAEQNCAGDYPPPPRHLSLPSMNARVRAGSAARKLYDARVSNTANARLLPVAGSARICFHDGSGCRMPVREPDVPDESPQSLLALVRERIRTRHLSLRTEQAYLQWIRRFGEFHGRRPLRELGPADIERFLTHLAVESHVGAATQNQALQALLFLYRQVLGIELPWLDNVT